MITTKYNHVSQHTLVCIDMQEAQVNPDLGWGFGTDHTRHIADDNIAFLNHLSSQFSLRVAQIYTTEEGIPNDPRESQGGIYGLNHLNTQTTTFILKELDGLFHDPLARAKFQNFHTKGAVWFMGFQESLCVPWSVVPACQTGRYEVHVIQDLIADGDFPDESYYMDHPFETMKAAGAHIHTSAEVKAFFQTLEA